MNRVQEGVHRPFTYVPRAFPGEKFKDINPSIIEDKKLLPYYQISNYGRVFNKYDNKFMIPVETSNHLYVHLRCKDDNGKSIDRTRTIHRCMMETFEYRDDCKDLEVDHIDGVSYNNILDNMEWVTREENIRRSYELKIAQRKMNTFGKMHPNIKLTDALIRRICEYFELGKTPTEVAKILDINKYAVRNIYSKRNWKHITKEYTW